MITATRTGTVLAALATLAAACAIAVPASAQSATSAPSAHALLSSRELWATIDVCSPPNQLNTIGIRGSMPGNRVAGDKMYMSFRLQYLNSSTKGWADLVSGATPRFVAVGAGTSARQGGRSFQLMPASGNSAVTLRGSWTSSGGREAR